MSLKLRRGIDADRQGVRFDEGELVYVTDYETAGVSPLWIGDGTTFGGVPIVNPENPISTIAGLDDVDASTVSIGQVLKWDGTKWINSDDTFGTSGAGIVEGSNYRINIVAEDSTIIVNSDTGVITADVTGDVTGNVAGNVTGSLDTGALTLDGDSITCTSSIRFNYDESVVFNGRNLKIENANADANVGSAAGIIFESSRGTTESPLTIQLGDKVATYTGAGWNGSGYSTLGGITIGTSVSTLGTEALPGAISMFVLGDNGGFDSFAQLDSSGVFTSLALQSYGLTTTQKTAIIDKFGGVGVAEDIVRGMIVYDTTLNKLTTFHPTEGWGTIQTSTAPNQLPVYADDAARSAAIPTPSAGMMVYMTSGTAPTVSNKPVFFNGTAWEAF